MKGLDWSDKQHGIQTLNVCKFRRWFLSTWQCTWVSRLPLCKAHVNINIIIWRALATNRPSGRLHQQTVVQWGKCSDFWDGACYGSAPLSLRVATLPQHVAPCSGERLERHQSSRMPRCIPLLSAPDHTRAASASQQWSAPRCKCRS